MNKTIDYRLLDKHIKPISRIIEKERYRDSDEFIDTAIKILLAWEGEHPEDTIKIMQGLMPFTPEQEAFMNTTMKQEEKERYFGKGRADARPKESERQKMLASSTDDHISLRNNLQNSRSFIKNLEIKKPGNIIEYDGYPLLFSFYSRFLPVKIVISALCNMLYEKKDWKATLTDLRVTAYDIAEEISEKISDHEKINGVPRNRKISTGLPKKGRGGKDIEKMAQAQKRFKDQFVGRVRKDRKIKKEQFDGAVGALGLIYVFRDNGEECVALTEKGKEFFLLHNPVVDDGDFGRGSLSEEEAKFILNELISNLALEKMLVDTAVSTIKNYAKVKNDEKITEILDREFANTAKKFVRDSPELARMHNLDKIGSMKEEVKKRAITSWRIATMGRLSELRAVTWLINESGDSEFSLN